MIHQFSQDFVNQCLKCNKDVDKLKKYNCIFEMIITSAKRRHSFVVFMYFDSIIRIFKIEFDKINNVHQTIQRFVN